MNPAEVPQVVHSAAGGHWQEEPDADVESLATDSRSWEEVRMKKKDGSSSNLKEETQAVVEGNGQQVAAQHRKTHLAALEPPASSGQ